jgi:dienelactone hydrolase
MQKNARVFWVLISLLHVVFAQCAFADGADTRTAFLRIVDRPRVALEPQLKPLTDVEGLKKFHLLYSSEADERVPGYVLLPDSKRFSGARPVVIAMHGTGGSKDARDIASIMEKAARAGFIAVAIDGRFHGERAASGGGVKDYNDAIARAWREGKGHPFYYDTAWDIMRLIDYLQTRKDVDGKRFGLTGISKGGIETYMTAAADTRVAAAVPYIGVQSFQWGLDHGQWRARIATIGDAFRTAALEAGKREDDVAFLREFYDRVVPGIYGPFDGPAMLAATAPRPVLVVNSDSDANTPIAGVRLAVQAAQPVYASLQASDKLVLRVQENTAHLVTPESIDAGIEWFVRWLKP